MCDQFAAVDMFGCTPLHYLCSNLSVDARMIELALDAHPTAAAAPDAQQCLPLHLLCRNLSISRRMLSMLLRAHPDAAHTCDGTMKLPRVSSTMYVGEGTIRAWRRSVRFHATRPRAESGRAGLRASQRVAPKSTSERSPICWPQLRSLSLFRYWSEKPG